MNYLSSFFMSKICMNKHISYSYDIIIIGDIDGKFI